MKHQVLAVLLIAGIISLYGVSEAADNKARVPSAASAKKAEALVKKGDKFDDNGELQKAISAYQDAARLDPGNFEASFNLGFVQLKADNPARAEVALKAAAALQPGDSEVHKLLGIACVKQGKKDEAIAAWKKSLSLKADQPDVEKFILMNEQK